MRSRFCSFSAKREQQGSNAQHPKHQQKPSVKNSRSMEPCHQNPSPSPPLEAERARQPKDSHKAEPYFVENYHEGCDTDDSAEDDSKCSSSASSAHQQSDKEQESGLHGLPLPGDGEDVMEDQPSGGLETLVMQDDCVRERLKRHRVEIAGRVWIPDIWGQEELLKDWIDCSGFDASLVPNGIMSARAALVEEGRRANSGGILKIENTC